MAGIEISKPSPRLLWLRAIFWLIAFTSGAMQAWVYRFAADPDGISYLDMGDAYLRGDWNGAINTLWSPLYSWILGMTMAVFRPAPRWEFPVVHLINFAIYLAGLVCFDLFLREAVHYYRDRAASSTQPLLPEWVWMTLGYSLYIWASLWLINLVEVKPDLCVAAFVYLAAGLILRIRRGAATRQTFIMLGAVLALAYLAKAPMFILSLIFLAGLFSRSNVRRVIPGVLITLVVFLLISSPLIIAISRMTGHITISESARLNYLWHINGIPYVHWQGEEHIFGSPIHPTRRILESPTIYEFATPVGGTYPPWYEPSYWNQGAVPRFSLMGHLMQLRSNLSIYRDILYIKYQLGLIFLWLILVISSWRTQFLRGLAAQWPLFLPSITALLMFSLIHLEPRYIAAFLVILWIALFSAVRLPTRQGYIRLVNCLVVITAGLGFLTVLTLTLRAARVEERGDLHWQVADGLRGMGIGPGDKVAIIEEPKSTGSLQREHKPSPLHSFWARLAKVKVVAEAPYSNLLWEGDAATKGRVHAALASTGAKVVVTGKVPPSPLPDEWRQINNTGYYALFLTESDGR